MSRTSCQGFNQYLDGSMSSVLFQEIREFRSLAYAIRGDYKLSFDFEKPGYFSGFLTTQSDKTADALDAFQSVITDLPRKPERVESIRKSLTLSINADLPGFRYRSETVSRWMAQGYKEDPRKSRYVHYENLEFREIQDFFDQNLKDKPWLVTIVGDTRRIDMEDLARYGEVEIVSLKEIFN
jgi:predicted Zn-dependent peptidase